MRKIIKWYLLIFLLILACAFGIWYASLQTGRPSNATLVLNSQAVPGLENREADAEPMNAAPEAAETGEGRSWEKLPGREKRTGAGKV